MNNGKSQKQTMFSRALTHLSRNVSFKKFGQRCVSTVEPLSAMVKNAPSPFEQIPALESALGQVDDIVSGKNGPRRALHRAILEEVETVTEILEKLPELNFSLDRLDS